MEAFRDRTIKIDIPYITRLAGGDQASTRRTSTRKQGAGQAHRPAHAGDRRDVGGAHAPRGAEEANLSLLQKLKLYDGKCCRATRRTRRSCARRRARGHGRHLAALRAGQDLQRARARLECINPFMVMNELEKGLGTTPDHQRRPAQALRDLHGVVKRGVRGDRQERGPARHRADEDAIAKLAATTSTTSRPTRRSEKVKNRYTGRDEEPDERLMRSIERRSTSPRSARTTSAARS
jgi:serine protein kinase